MVPGDYKLSYKNTWSNKKVKDGMVIHCFNPLLTVRDALIEGWSAPKMTTDGKYTYCHCLIDELFSSDT